MLTIWGRLNSHNVKKVVWLADEIGIAHVRHDVGGKFGMDDAYRALNPNALVPTIEDEGLVLWESNAILRYLAARYAQSTPMWPDNPVVRAVGDKWMDWQFGLADAQRDAFHNLIRRSESERDPAAIERSAAATAEMMARVDDALAQSPWLSGETFGIGDIPVGVYAHTYFSLAVQRPDLPHLADWYGRLKARPAYAKSVMIPLS